MYLLRFAKIRSWKVFKKKHIWFDSVYHRAHMAETEQIPQTSQGQIRQELSNTIALPNTIPPLTSSQPTSQPSLDNKLYSPNVVGVHYKVGRKIGEGSFGVIYEGLS